MRHSLFSYKFGSYATGLNTELSDQDTGIVVWDGWENVIQLNSSLEHKETYLSQKNEYGDAETLSFHNFMTQVFLPSPNFHAKVMTLKRDGITHNVTFNVFMNELIYILDNYTYWRSYLYKVKSFGESCDVNSVKGLKHKLYTYLLALQQLKENTFSIHPVFWNHEENVLFKFHNNLITFEEAVVESDKLNQQLNNELEKLILANYSDTRYEERYSNVVNLFVNFITEVLEHDLSTL